MNIPKTREIKQPVLEYLGRITEQDVKIPNLIEAMAKHFGLTKQGAKTPSGGKIFVRRVKATLMDLKDFDLIELTRREHVAITQKGRDNLHVPEAQPKKADATKQRSTPSNDEDNDKFIQMATTIAASYVANNPVHFEQIPEIIKGIYKALLELRGQPVQTQLRRQPAQAQTTSRQPAVSIENSIARGHIICLECGRDFKSLKKHLLRHNEMTPDEYRKKWGLPPDYPMVARKYASSSSKTAKQTGPRKNVG